MGVSGQEPHESAAGNRAAHARAESMRGRPQRPRVPSDHALNSQRHVPAPRRFPDHFVADTARRLHGQPEQHLRKEGPCPTLDGMIRASTASAIVATVGAIAPGGSEAAWSIRPDASSKPPYRATVRAEHDGRGRHMHARRLAEHSASRAGGTRGRQNDPRHEGTSAGRIRSL